MRVVKIRSGCPISSALDIIGDKWSLLIIRDIMFFEKNTYSDFASSDEKIATNILADRLSLLESTGIITKRAHPKSKAMYYYKLTRKGIDLMPVLMELIVWSDTYGNFSKDIKTFARKIKKNKAGLIEQISSGLK